MGLTIEQRCELLRYAVAGDEEGACAYAGAIHGKHGRVGGPIGGRIGGAVTVAVQQLDGGAHGIGLPPEQREEINRTRRTEGEAAAEALRLKHRSKAGSHAGRASTAARIKRRRAAGGFLGVGPKEPWTVRFQYRSEGQLPFSIRSKTCSTPEQAAELYDVIILLLRGANAELNFESPGAIADTCAAASAFIDKGHSLPVTPSTMDFLLKLRDANMLHKTGPLPKEGGGDGNGGRSLSRAK